jgi:hypothetical protein
MEDPRIVKVQKLFRETEKLSSLILEIEQSQKTYNIAQTPKIEECTNMLKGLRKELPDVEKFRRQAKLLKYSIQRIFPYYTEIYVRYIQDRTAFNSIMRNDINLRKLIADKFKSWESMKRFYEKESSR